jgi:hypothetical protein
LFKPQAQKRQRSEPKISVQRHNAEADFGALARMAKDVLAGQCGELRSIVEKEVSNA